MEQQQCVKFLSEDEKIILLCDSDTALGSLHDFLMRTKGHIVDRMIAAQKAEAEAAQKQKEAE